MWNWFKCYLSGRHEYGIWCEPGAIFLRCVHCGQRSPGWHLAAKAKDVPPQLVKAQKPVAAMPRVLPFERSAAR